MLFTSSLIRPVLHILQVTPNLVKYLMRKAQPGHQQHKRLIMPSTVSIATIYSRQGTHDSLCKASSGGPNDTQASGQAKVALSGSHANIFGDEDSGDALSSAPPSRRNNQEASFFLSRDSFAILKSSKQPTPSAVTADPPTSSALPQIRTSRSAPLPIIRIFNIISTTFPDEFGPTLEALAPLAVFSSLKILPANLSQLESERMHTASPTDKQIFCCRVREGPGGQDHIGSVS